MSEPVEIQVLSPTSIKNDHTLSPQKYVLFQNHPNPFNPDTRIKFQLPEKEKVSIQIFNNHGVKLKTLINEIRDAGYHEVSWNGKDSYGKNIPSGVYLYRIHAGEFFQVRKMVLVR